MKKHFIRGFFGTMLMILSAISVITVIMLVIYLGERISTITSSVPLAVLFGLIALSIIGGFINLLLKE